MFWSCFGQPFFKRFLFEIFFDHTRLANVVAAEREHCNLVMLVCYSKVEASRCAIRANCERGANGIRRLLECKSVNRAARPCALIICRTE